MKYHWPTFWFAVILVALIGAAYVDDYRRDHHVRCWKNGCCEGKTFADSDCE